MIGADEKEKFLRLVMEKVSWLQIDHLVMSCRVKTDTLWKTVSSELAQFIQKTSSSALVLPIFPMNPTETGQLNQIHID